MRNIDKFVAELNELKLPLGEYAVISSGPLAIRGIRDCKDLDIIVTKKLFENLAGRYPAEQIGDLRKISIGNIEMLDVSLLADETYPVERQIAEAELVDGVPFQNLETCIYFKERGGREKDLKDLELISQYLKKEVL